MSKTCVNLKSKKTRLRCANDLRAAGITLRADDADYKDIETHYDIGVSAHIISRIENPNDPEHDPIARQYIPTSQELKIAKDEESDPIGDNVYSPVRGIVHRYPDRALFKVTNICAVYCRYCFRREMVGAGSDHLSNADFDAAINYIKTQKQIWEVILTGGDPLVLSAAKLQKIIDALNAIDHVKIIRIHTRIPIADPAKIDKTLLSVLQSSSKAIHMVLHVNHAREISETVSAALFALRQSNCSLFSQSVLLKGVNDDAKILEDLFKALLVLHVKPYYLHHLDRAKGTSHFRVSIKRGQAIMKDLQGRISGLCLPHYMLDIPGGHGKIPINDSYVTALDLGTYRVEDYQGCTHLYIEQDGGARA